MVDDKTLNAAVADRFDDYYNSIFDGADPSSELYAKETIDLVKTALRPSEDYLEVHFEVTSIIIMNDGYYLDKIEESNQPEKGTGGLWVLAKRITDQFIKEFDEGVMIWDDFFLELDDFVENFKI